MDLHYRSELQCRLSVTTVGDIHLTLVQIFTARCYASAVLAMGLCLCPLSVRHKSVFY